MEWTTRASVVAAGGTSLTPEQPPEGTTLQYMAACGQDGP